MTTSEPDHLRRAALKAGVAGIGAVVVWSEPTIKGLARRPAYASSGSQPLTITHTITILRTGPSMGMVKTLEVVGGGSGSFGPGEPSFDLEVLAASVVRIADDPAGNNQITFASVTSDPDLVVNVPQFSEVGRRLRIVTLDDRDTMMTSTVTVTMVCEPL